MSVTIGPGHLRLAESHRFTNEPVRIAGRLELDWPRIVSEVLRRLRSADADGGLGAIGIDAWGVDYGLLDERGELLGNPVHYRDRRTRGMPGRARHLVDDVSFYAVTGTQFQTFNTAYQVLAELDEGERAGHAVRLLLIPDLLTYHLTGRACAEITNASTTQLVDAATQDSSTDLVNRLGIPRGWLPPLLEPGTVIGRLRPEYVEIGSDPMVVSVASHDTASAVAAVPAEGDGFAYISCGTWSLVGVELEAPILSEESRHAKFTNELGLDRTVRYLRRGYSSDRTRAGLDTRHG